MIIGGSGYLGAHIIRHFSNDNFINISYTRSNPDANNNIVLSDEMDLEKVYFDSPIDLLINVSDKLACVNESSTSRCYANFMQQIINFSHQIGVKKVIHFSRLVDVPRLLKQKEIANRLLLKSGLEATIIEAHNIVSDNCELHNITQIFRSRQKIPKHLSQKTIKTVSVDEMLKVLDQVVDNKHQSSQIQLEELHENFHSIVQSALGKNIKKGVLPLFLEIEQIKSCLSEEQYLFYKRFIYPLSE